MKSIKKILTVFTSTCFILGSCDIDPTLTSSYPSDIIWSNYGAQNETYIED